MTFEHAFDVIAPTVLPPIILALAAWAASVMSGLTAQARTWLEAHNQAQASAIVADASVRFQAGMQNAAGQMALEVQQGKLNLNDIEAVNKRLAELAQGLLRKMPDAASVLRPAPNSIVEGISGKITAALPVPDPAPPPAPAAPQPPPPLPPGSDRRDFFNVVRRNVFGGRLVQSQVDGCNKILDFWHDTAPSTDVRHLAYSCATVFWETAHTMQPVEEIGQGKGRFYGATGFYGRGLVQLTLQDNYRRMSTVAGCDLVANPERALEWPIALRVLFSGMTLGMFTGKKLADYFNATIDDPVGARAIVNGSDHAEDVAGIYRAFLAALEDAASEKLAA